jgi:uncharacterized protein DUF3226
MTAKVKQNAPHRLIVEGRDDQWSIIALTTRNGWDWNHPAPYLPYIDNAEGVENALDAIEVSVRTYPRVGIVLDADIVPMDRWNAVRGRLAPSGLPLPESPAADGTIVEGHGKRVGVWLMPDNQNPGKLEDFLAVLIPPGDRCWPWAEQATRKAREEHGASFSTPDSIKAQIHTWLSWQAEPGLPFGTAITAATFAHDATLATTFVRWMTQLYT